MKKIKIKFTNKLDKLVPAEIIETANNNQQQSDGNTVVAKSTDNDDTASAVPITDAGPTALQGNEKR